MELASIEKNLTIFISGPSKLLTQVRWESSVPSEHLEIPEKKPRKTYKVMRKVNPTEDILSPEQWKHMRVSQKSYTCIIDDQLRYPNFSVALIFYLASNHDPTHTMESTGRLEKETYDFSYYWFCGGIHFLLYNSKNESGFVLC